MQQRPPENNFSSSGLSSGPSAVEICYQGGPASPLQWVLQHLSPSVSDVSHNDVLAPFSFFILHTFACRVRDTRRHIASPTRNPVPASEPNNLISGCGPALIIEVRYSRVVVCPIAHHVASDSEVIRLFDALDALAVGTSAGAAVPRGVDTIMKAAPLVCTLGK